MGKIGANFCHATAVRSTFWPVAPIPLELEGWSKKRKVSIFYGLSLCTQTFFSKVDRFHVIWQNLIFGPILDAYFKCKNVQNEHFSAIFPTKPKCIQI